MSNRQRA
jgi:hypothetical protein